MGGYRLQRLRKGVLNDCSILSTAFRVCRGTTTKGVISALPMRAQPAFTEREPAMIRSRLLPATTGRASGKSTRSPSRNARTSPAGVPGWYPGGMRGSRKSVSSWSSSFFISSKDWMLPLEAGSNIFMKNFCMTRTAVRSGKVIDERICRPPALPKESRYPAAFLIDVPTGIVRVSRCIHDPPPGLKTSWRPSPQAGTPLHVSERIVDLMGFSCPVT